MRRRVLTLSTSVALTAGVLLAGVGVSSASAARPLHGVVRPTTSVSTVSAVSTPPQIRQGASGIHVLTLQAALIGYGYDLKGTGNFGPKTKAAVVDFQKRNGINASGIVGPKTWSALGVSYNPNRYATITLKPGYYHGDVDCKIDNTADFLAELELRFPTWAAKGDISGNYYRGRSVKTVQEFQRRVGIKPSGIIGPKTTEAMSTFMGVAGDHNAIDHC